MAFPNFPGKHDHPALATAEAALRWRRDQGLLPADLPVPDAAIFTYQPQLFAAVKGREPHAKLVGAGLVGETLLLDRTEGRVAVCGRFGFGAPVAAILMEHLIALGVQRFVSMGTAGGLDPAHRIGDVLLCTAAVRDEGLSHHYLPAAPWAYPDPVLTAGLGAALTGRDVAHSAAPVWTIDSPYQETAAEIRHYRAEGVAGVEMEAAALFTVAAVRRVAVASAFAVSDVVDPDAWTPGFADPALAESLWRVFEASVDALDP